MRFFNTLNKHLPKIMKSINITFITLLAVIQGFSLSATNYYFSSVSGDDSRSYAEAQNPETPWKSISKLNEIFSDLQPGDQVLFKRGEEFPGAIYVNQSGQQNAPIVISAYGEGAKPIISGFTTVTSWSQRGNGIYESAALPVSNQLNMLVVGGKNYPMGRYPNPDDPEKGYLIIDDHSGNSISDDDFPGDRDWTGAELVIRSGPWVIDRVKITGHNSNRVNYNQSTSYTPEPGYGYFIQSDPKTLDQFGEWYFNDNNQRVQVYFGSESPLDFKVQAASVDILVEVHGNHVVFDGLSFMGANKFTFFSEDFDSRDLRVQNCDITFSGVDAMYMLGKSGIVVENCHINHSNNNALTLNYMCLDATIRNNTIRNTGMQAGMGLGSDSKYVALFNRNDGMTCENNRVINTGYIGIDFGGDNVLVKNNLVDSFCVVKGDGGGIYTYGEGKTNQNQQVVDNIIMNGFGAVEGSNSVFDAPAEGIYLDDNSNNIDLIGNTIANCGNNGIFLHNTQQITLRNNTVYNSRYQLAAQHDHLGEAIRGLDIRNNIFFAKKTTQLAASIRTIKNDINQMGTIQDNYFVRPFDDGITIENHYENNAGKRIEGYDVEEYGKGSKKGPMEFEEYELLNITSGNMVDNGTFDESAHNVWCFSPYWCGVDWTANSDLDGGALKIESNTESFFGMETGPIDYHKKYIIRFSAIANQEGSLKLFFRQLDSPWADISRKRAVKIGPERREYEVLIEYPVTDDYSTIVFETGEGNLECWIDNVEIYEAELRMNDPDQFIRLEYNPTFEDKKVSLGGTYMDVENNYYAGEMTLAPFESVLLMRTTDCTLGFSSSTQNPSCGNAANGRIVINVTSGKAPFEYLWSTGATTANLEGASAGTFSVTITDGDGCVGSQSFELTAASEMALAIESQAGGCGSQGSTTINAIVTGGSGQLNYEWNTGETGTSSIEVSQSGTYSVLVTDDQGCTVTGFLEVEVNPGLDLTLDVRQMTQCDTEDGRITAQVSSGQEPFTYQWNNGQTTSAIQNLGPGTYEVTVTDQAGCTQTASATIDPITSLAIEIQNNPSSACASPNGSASVNILSGTGPYQYEWNNGDQTSQIGQLGAGVYTVTVTDDLGCVATGTATIEQPDGPTLSVATTGVTMVTPNGTATVTVQNGAGPFDYSWSDGQTTATATDLPAGYHSVIVSDINGCSTEVGGIVENFIVNDDFAMVLLDHFTVEPQNCKAAFQWQLQIEGDVKSFEVLRSVDNASYFPIANITANLVDKMGAYVYQDPQASGKLFYRLKLISEDGSYYTTDAVEVEITCSLPTYNTWDVYPTLLTKEAPQLKVEYEVEDLSKVDFSVVNLSGRTVDLFTEQPIQVGKNGFEYNTADLPPGLYYMSNSKSKAGEQPKNFIIND